MNRSLPIALLLVSSPALADDDAPEDSLQIHGWASQGALVSTGNNYLAQSKRGSFEFFDAGLNVTKELGSDIRAGVQIFAQDLGPIGNYAPIVDFAYVDYKLRPELGFRAGHFKMPLNLHSDRLDADMTRTTVLMPQAVYDARFRDVLAAVSGLDAYGTLDLGEAGKIDYDAYVGTLFIAPRGSEYDVENLAGTRVVYSTPIPCLRVAGHALYGNFHEKNDLGGGMSLNINYNDWTMMGGAVECTTEKVTLTAEFSRWHSNLSFDPMVQPDVEYNELRAYAQAEVRATDTFSASIYGSAYRDTTGGANPHHDDNHQYDGAASVRYDITPNFLVKAEGHAIQGYGATQGSLNPGPERASRWGLFLVKTTLTF